MQRRWLRREEEFMSQFLRALKLATRELIGGRLQVDPDELAVRGHYGTRKFHRHSFKDLPIGKLEFGDYQLPVTNLSVGGLMVQADPTLFRSIFQGGSRFKARLYLLGVYRQMVFSVAHLEATMVGLRVELQDKLDLAFLDSFIRFLDVGLVLQSWSKQRVNQIYRGPAWHSYSIEDESVEVHLNLDRSSCLREARVTYIDGRRRDFCSLSPQGIQITSNPKRKLTKSEKRQILRNTVLILTGLRQVGQTDRLDAVICAAIDSATSA